MWRFWLEKIEPTNELIEPGLCPHIEHHRSKVLPRHVIESRGREPMRNKVILNSLVNRTVCELLQPPHHLQHLLRQHQLFRTRVSKETVDIGGERTARVEGVSVIHNALGED